MTAADDIDGRLRAAVFAHLDRLGMAHPAGISAADINTFSFEGKPMRLSVQSGIWKPAILTAALTIRTTYTPEGHAPPYADEVGPDGVVRYKWRGLEPDQSDNRALREAMVRRLPLAYFVPVTRGVYHALYPVFLVDEDRQRHEFVVEIGETHDVANLSDATTAADLVARRAYTHRLTLQRLHQAVFRPKVLRAYESKCALCRLAYPPLLDAAHILRDGHERGDPIVANGLAMCKIHHAAYDISAIGIRPDHQIQVRAEILAQIDGPMLRHGLQEMHGQRIFLPRSPADRPHPDRLAERYDEFLAA